MRTLDDSNLPGPSSSLAGLDVYFYGMSVLSTIHRVAGALLLDGYAEIVESYVCPGGEAMNGAMLLAGLGLKTALGGPHFGTATCAVLTRYAERYGVDVSTMRLDEGYAGLEDVVLVAAEQRTVLGRFGSYFADPTRRWSEPDEGMIERASVVAIDPFFGESSLRAAALAARYAKPYVTIDCEYDGPLHARAAVTVVSREYRARTYAGTPDARLLADYSAHGPGLTIFTAGKGAIAYGRRAGGGVFSPFEVAVKSTLGAGDAFRAGVVFGVLKQFDDAACVRFAAGLSALLCTTLPIAEHVPSLAEVESFLENPSALVPHALGG